MVNWKVTATTIYCDLVDADVPITVFKDWSTKCGFYIRHSPKKNENTAKIQENKRQKLNDKLGCDGPECSRVTEYRDKLFAEEEKKVDERKACL
jgi:hypothetical protein